MIFLIRYKNYNTGGNYDVKMVAPQISIGCGLDQHIQVSGSEVAKAHAIIKPAGITRKKARLTGLYGNKIQINDRRVRSSGLSPGDEIQFPSHRIKIIEPVVGFDFSCEVEIDSDELRADFKESLKTEFVARRWTPRRLAYGFSLLLIIFAFLWPYSAYLSGKNDNDSDHQWAGMMSAIANLDQRSWRGDVFWSPGPLIDAHQNAIGNNCSACHTQAFQAVADAACVTCHAQSQQHFNVSNLANAVSRLTAFDVQGESSGQDNSGPEEITNTPVSIDTELRCENCHKEHNEPQTIISEVDLLCTTCHDRELAKMDGSKAQSATAFNLEAHPEFQYSMLVANNDLASQSENSPIVDSWETVIQPANLVAVENSHLEFSHEFHLQLDEPPLNCSNCHRLDVDNEHFETINMRDHCSSCHKLEFNGREIPHGDTALAIRSIEEYFIALYVTPDREIETPPRRLPGRTVRTCEDTDYACAIAKAEEEIQLQFDRSGCITCHRVSSIDNGSITQDQLATLGAGTSSLSPLSQSWIVEEVRLNADWYGKAHFDHLSHLTQTGQSEIEQCSGCHQATTSEHSSDVLIPKITTCFQCHNDNSANSKISMGCVHCHSHHPSAIAAQIQPRQGDP